MWPGIADPSSVTGSWGEPKGKNCNITLIYTENSTWTLMTQYLEIEMYIIWFCFLKICFNYQFLGILLSNAGIAITVDFTIMLLYKWENEFFKVEKKRILKSLEYLGSAGLGQADAHAI